MKLLKDIGISIFSIPLIILMLIFLSVFLTLMSPLLTIWIFINRRRLKDD